MEKPIAPRSRLTLVLAALPLILLARRGAEAEVDAVTAASLTVAVSGITSSTASIGYSKDRYSSGTRTLYYNPAPAAATQNATAKRASGNAGSFSVSGLAPNTQYNYKIEASDGRHESYSTSGSFKTTASTAIRIGVGADAGTQTDGARFDAAGRSLRPSEASAGQRAIFTGQRAAPVYR
jgi:hypothetical protein